MLAKKSLGQNFLMHAQTAARIADAARLTPESTVLEIGPGTGMLTKELLARAGRVIAIEADPELIPVLTERFETEIASGKLDLIYGDVRSFDPSTIQGRYSLAANIPYYITGEIIRMFLTANHKPSQMTLLVQKEVAERIARSKKESLLSLSVKAFGTPRYCFTVPRGAFKPAPNVDSAVLAIEDIRPDAFADALAEQRFFDVLRAGFSQKRKRLAKNLEQIASRESIERAFAACALSLNMRAEDVTLTTWMMLVRELGT